MRLRGRRYVTLAEFVRESRRRVRGKWPAVYKRDPCAYCGAPSTTLDHIEPRSRGHRLTWANATGACRPCNCRKSSLSLLVYLATRHAVGARKKALRLITPSAIEADLRKAARRAQLATMARRRMERKQEEARRLLAVVLDAQARGELNPSRRRKRR